MGERALETGRSHSQIKEMEDFKIEVLSASDQTLSEEAGIPRLFMGAVKDQWQKNSSGEIVAVVLSNRSASAWSQVGNAIVDSFAYYQVGICFDGDMPPSGGTPYWLNLMKTVEQSSHLPSIIEIKCMAVPHPKGQTTVLNTTCIAIQCATQASWLKSLWQDIDSRKYNQGCDLIVTFYGSDLVAELKWSEALGIERFCRTLTKCTGWVIPLDGNVGFIVGVSDAKKFCEQFRASK